MGISEILNRTNYRLLAWYFNPVETRKSGLKHFSLVHQEPMQSTGKEKFTVYVYYKTKKYDPTDLQDWQSSSEEEEDVPVEIPQQKAAEDEESGSESDDTDI